MRSFKEEAGYVIASFQAADIIAKNKNETLIIIEERTKLLCRQMLINLGHKFTQKELDTEFEYYYFTIRAEFESIFNNPQKMLAQTTHIRNS